MLDGKFLGECHSGHAAFSSVRLDHDTNRHGARNINSRDQFNTGR